MFSVPHPFPLLHTLAVRSSFSQLQLIRQLQAFLDQDNLTTVFHALWTSHLDYCNALYMGLALGKVRSRGCMSLFATWGKTGWWCSPATPLPLQPSLPGLHSGEVAVMTMGCGEISQDFGEIRGRPLQKLPPLFLCWWWRWQGPPWQLPQFSSWAGRSCSRGCSWHKAQWVGCMWGQTNTSK